MLIELPGPRKYLLGALGATPHVLGFLLRGLSDEEADFRPDAERFSIREAVAHLADWDAIFLERLRRTRDEHEPLLLDIDEGQIALDHGYAQSEPFEQLQVLAARRAEIIEFARELSPDQWSRFCEHERAGRMTLEALATLIPLHDAYHLEQVAQWRQSWAARGNAEAAPST